MDNQPLNNLEASIILILEEHRGQAEAIKREDLVRQICDLQEYQISDRLIRITIKHLVTQHGVAIGSCHWGYFMVQSIGELDQVCKYFRSYGLSSLFVESRLRKQHITDLLGQIKMEFEAQK